jgi:hypothetical protein
MKVRLNAGQAFAPQTPRGPGELARFTIQKARLARVYGWRPAAASWLAQAADYRRALAALRRSQ